MAKTAKKVQETLVNFILDKSGSMGSIQESTISGFNEYLNTLKKDGNKYSFSLTLFDTVVDKVIINEPISKVDEMSPKTYRPDGMTALYDSACQTIDAVEKTLKDNQKVLIVIMTDGQENSSKEFTQKDLRDRVQRLEKTGKWTFVFLGANQDSYQTASAFGIGQMNTVNYAASDTGMKNVMRTMASNTAFYAASANLSTQDFFSKTDQQNLQADISGVAPSMTSSNGVDPKISAHFSSLGKKGYEAKRKKLLGE